MGLLKHVICALALAVLAAPGGALAQSVSGWAETRAMLAAPDDPALVFAFVERARAAGRADAAAMALERLLRFRSDNREARALLAEVYDEIGVPEQAAALRGGAGGAAFESVQGTRVSGYLGVGGGYESNANAAPYDDRFSLFIPSLGAFREVDLGVSRQDSPLGFLQAGVEVETAGDDSLPPILFRADAEAIFYTDASDQDEQTLSASVGPVLAAGSGRLRPFVAAEHRRYDGDPYSYGVFGGLNYQAGSTTTRWELEAQAGWRDHDPNTSAPNRNDLDGFEAEASAALLTQLDRNVFGRLKLTALGRDADAAHQSFVSLAADAALIHRIPASADIPELTLSAGGGGLLYYYDEPDPSIDPTRTRRDRALYGFFNAGAKLDEATTADATLAYRRRYSRYDIYDSDGWRATLRLVRRF